MNVVWLFRTEFGAFLLLFAGLLGRSIQPGVRSATQRNTWHGMSVEGAVLLAATAAVAGRYVWLLLERAAARELPPIGGAWVAAFGAACAIYLGTKTVRTKLVRS
jgi:hypothetical protein